MRAIGVTKFGGPDALQTVVITEPSAGPGEVRIRVTAASINPSDLTFRSGGYASALKGVPPYIPGWDLAGTIDEVGDGADWTVGDEVVAFVVPFGPRVGAYADKVVVSADSVARIPADAGFTAASTLPLNGLTARMSLDQWACGLERLWPSRVPQVPTAVTWCNSLRPMAFGLSLTRLTSMKNLCPHSERT
jgi:NADPH:quinone reductase-like Zn-dependent oxidoreductase